MASARVSIYWLLFEKKTIPATVEPTFSVIYGSNVDCNAKKLNTNTWTIDYKRRNLKLCSTV